MNFFNSTVALVLALVVQFSQVSGYLAMQESSSCVDESSMSCCCAAVKSCPCVEESPNHEKPEPLFPASIDLKQLVSKTAENPILVDLDPPATASTNTAATSIFFHGAYQGVPLSVAFCKFVI